jgi:ankyrin repeat protein
MDHIPLFKAIGQRDLARVAEILDSGADPNHVSPGIGNTPLYNACFGDRLEVVQLLLARGAKPNLRFTYSSPVDGRVEKDVVALMFARSAPVAAALLEAGADPNAQDAAGNSPLMRAVLGGTVAQVKLLLEHGADATVRNRNGDAAADLARARLKWLVECLPRLKESEGLQRKANLETILSMVEQATS